MHLCAHTHSYNTRKPTRDVISLRQNAERLRATGRVEEAEEFDKQAQIIDDKADKVATSTVIMFVLWLILL
jgi:hypothetical protein